MQSNGRKKSSRSQDGVKSGEMPPRLRSLCHISSMRPISVIDISMPQKSTKSENITAAIGYEKSRAYLFVAPFWFGYRPGRRHWRPRASMSTVELRHCLYESFPPMIWTTAEIRSRNYREAFRASMAFEILQVCSSINIGHGTRN